MSLSNYLENKLVDHVCGGSAFTQPSGVYAKLHTGDPGEDGTANAATETTRKALSFGAASGGVATQSGTASWTNVAATETVTHISLWDASSAGNCLGSGALTASKSLQAGDNFDLTSVTFTLT